MASTFYIQGLAGLETKLKEYPDKVKKVVHDKLVDAVTEINAEQIKRAPIYNNAIRGHTGWMEKGDLVFELFSQMPYSAYMEFGTKSKFQAIPGIDASEYKGQSFGKAQSMFDAILRWVQDKRIAATLTKSGNRSQSADALEREKQAAWAIMRSILLYGVKPHPFFFAPFLERRERLRKDIEREINKI